MHTIEMYQFQYSDHCNSMMDRPISSALKSHRGDLRCLKPAGGDVFAPRKTFMMTQGILGGLDSIVDHMSS